MIIDYHSNKSIIGIYNIIDYDNRLIVPALVNILFNVLSELHHGLCRLSNVGYVNPR